MEPQVEQLSGGFHARRPRVRLWSGLPAGEKRIEFPLPGPGGVRGWVFLAGAPLKTGVFSV